MPALLYLRTRTKALGNTHPCACRRARAFVVLFILALVLFVQQHQVRSAWLLCVCYSRLLDTYGIDARKHAHAFVARARARTHTHTHTHTVIVIARRHQSAPSQRQRPAHRFVDANPAPHRCAVFPK